MVATEVSFQLQIAQQVQGLRVAPIGNTILGLCTRQRGMLLLSVAMAERWAAQRHCQCTGSEILNANIVSSVSLREKKKPQ